METLKGISRLVTSGAPEIVYMNVNVWAGTKRIKEAFISFKIENSWLENNNLKSNQVGFVRWDDNKWVQLETTEKAKDSEYTYFESKTGAFSSFAIIGIGSSDETIPDATTTGSEMVQETTGEIPDQKEESAFGFEAGLVLATLSVLYIFSRKKR